MTFEKNERLENVSELIRQGTPVSMADAIAAIEYQASLQQWRKNNSWWRRAWKWIISNAM